MNPCESITESLSKILDSFHNLGTTSHQTYHTLRRLDTALLKQRWEESPSTEHSPDLTADDDTHDITE